MAYAASATSAPSESMSTTSPSSSVIRRLLDSENGHTIRIIAKIESVRGVEAIDEILQVPEYKDIFICEVFNKLKLSHFPLSLYILKWMQKIIQFFYIFTVNNDVMNIILSCVFFIYMQDLFPFKAQ